MRLAVCVGVVAVLSAGGRADAQEKKPDVVAKLEGHRGGVTAIAFRPDTRVPLVATGAGNGVVRVWEAKTGELAFRLDPARSGSGTRINHLAFSSAWNGYLLSASSRNAVVVWNLEPPPPPKKDPNDPKLPELKDVPPKGQWMRELPAFFEDGVGNDPVKIGTVTGDGRRVYFSTTEGARVGVGSRAFSPQLGTDTADELKGAFSPWALSAMPDADSALVALYGSMKAADKTDLPAVAFVGLGDSRVIGRGTVRAPITGRPTMIGFAPDGKWLIACNGEDLMYWRVPGSQVVEGDPKFLTGPAYAAAAGPSGRVAFASPPEEGKKVKVTIADVSASPPKTLAVYATDIDRVSALAFSRDGATLAVADDSEGVVQLWNVAEKK